MKPRPKKCRGQGKASEHPGCGGEFIGLRFGLCRRCLAEWTLTTNQGREWLSTQTASLRRKRAIEEKRHDREETARVRESLVTLSEYWSKHLQPTINRLARAIDFGNPCIATERMSGKMNGGHFIHAGVNKTLSVNLHNIHIQTFESNHHRSGDLIKYREGIIKVYGSEYLDFMEGLRACPAINPTKDDLKRWNSAAKKIVAQIERERVIRSPRERIELRNECNRQLGIYPDAFSIFVK